MALPALQALAATYEPAEVDLVGYPSVLRLVEHTVPALPVGKIHSIDRSLFAPLFSGGMSDELGVFLGSYDLVVAWVHDRHGALREKLRRLPVACLQSDPYPPEGSRTHASEHLLRSLSALGVLDTRGPLALPRLRPPGEALEEGESILRRLGLGQGRLLLVHPGSGSPHKNWAAEKFAALCRMAKRTGRSVLVLEGESDEDAVRRLDALAGEPLACLRQPSLATLLAIACKASQFLGNDSGIAHLVAATGTPTVAVFGPTDPAMWAPRGSLTAVVGFETPPETVWAELERLERATNHGGNPTNERRRFPP